MYNNKKSVQTSEYVINPCNQTDANLLTKLSISAKASWGYSETFMREAYDELKVTESALVNVKHRFFKAITQEGLILGFYQLIFNEDKFCELNSLFVDPDCMGNGVGTNLLKHALNHAQQTSHTSVLLTSDPHAVEFYSKFGAVIIGKHKSPVMENRYLPIMEFKLNNLKLG